MDCAVGRTLSKSIAASDCWIAPTNPEASPKSSENEQSKQKNAAKDCSEGMCRARGGLQKGMSGVVENARRRQPAD